MPDTILWESPIQTRVAWGCSKSEEPSPMYRHPDPIRNGNRVCLAYVFRNRDGTPISLEDKPQITLLAKREGSAGTAAAAVLDSDPTSGKVSCTFKFDGYGVWNVQFKADDTTGDAPIEGDIAWMQVGKNIEDLAAGDSPIEE